MKKLKKILIFVVTLISVLIISFLILLCLDIVHSIYKSMYIDPSFENRYNIGKNKVSKYLSKNKKSLEEIASKMYKTKSSIRKYSKDIDYISYRDYTKYGGFENDAYIGFDFYTNWEVGAQYYGLIYSKDVNIYDNKFIYIYDENKETGEGNNIFIREKIDNDWYYYYDDYDGRVNISKIK